LRQHDESRFFLPSHLCVPANYAHDERRFVRTRFTSSQLVRPLCDEASQKLGISHARKNDGLSARKAQDMLGMQCAFAEQIADEVKGWLLRAHFWQGAGLRRQLPKSEHL